MILILIMSLYAFANIGTVMALKGKATLKRGTNIVLKVGMSIKQGDKITTKRQSRIQVMLKDDSVITIGSNSSFHFREFKFKNRSSKVNFKANKGFFRVVTGKIGKLAPDRFRIKTTTAIIGIRGTDFSGNITRGKEVIRCYSGSIWVKLNSGVIKNLDSGMLLEITNKSSKVKNAITGASINQEITDKIDISDVTSDITKPADIDKDIHQDIPTQPDYYDDYKNY